MEHFSTRKRALDEERYLISYHQPPHNTQGRDVTPSRAHQWVPDPQFARKINGRLNWQKTLDDVDIDTLAPKGSLASHHIRRAYFDLRTQGGSVADLRQRLRALFTPEKDVSAI